MGGYELSLPPSDRDIGSAIAAGIPYEPHVAATIRRALAPGDSFLDVGANIGYFTAMAAHIVGPSGKVIAIEPMDKNLQLIYATVNHNRFTQVEVWPFAASNHASIVRIVTDPGTSNALVQHAPSARGTSLCASARALDDLLAGVLKIDLMKVDTEGHEPLVWEGFRNGMARCKPRIVTEFHPHSLRTNTGVEPSEYLKLLFGYSPVVNVIEDDGTHTECRDDDAVMEHWRNADTRRQSHGTTHLDLFIDPRV
jgi:FkbM family methyltransferase